MMLMIAKRNATITNELLIKETVLCLQFLSYRHRNLTAISSKTFQFANNHLHGLNLSAIKIVDVFKSAKQLKLEINSRQRSTLPQTSTKFEKEMLIEFTNARRIKNDKDAPFLFHLESSYTWLTLFNHFIVNSFLLPYLLLFFFNI